MRKYLNKALSKFNYRLEKTGGSKELVLKNVFNTNFKKKMLMSYMKAPFVKDITYEHSNVLECYTAAECFRDMGYNVDVAEFNEPKSDKIEYEKYDVIYGFGKPMEQSFFADNAEKIKRILYGTGCNVYYADVESALQVREFYKKTGKLIPSSSRVAPTPFCFQSILSDKIIVLGNDFAKSTYERKGHDLPIENLNAFYHDVYDIDLEQKNFDEARKHFLWFGSSGALHKGLDLIIEAFKQRPNLILHICGASPQEKKFTKYYEKELGNKVPNIINHGFVDLKSGEFKEIMNTCSALVYPSISEGGAVATLNVMANGGLVPIVSKQVSLDIDNFGFYIEDLTVEGVTKSLEEFLKLSTDKIKELSIKTKNTVRDEYSYDLYKKNLKRIIGSVLK